MSDVSFIPDYHLTTEPVHWELVYERAPPILRDVFTKFATDTAREYMDNNTLTPHKMEISFPKRIPLRIMQAKADQKLKAIFLRNEGRPGEIPRVPRVLLSTTTNHLKLCCKRERDGKLVVQMTQIHAEVALGETW